MAVGLSAHNLQQGNSSADVTLQYATIMIWDRWHAPQDNHAALLI